jgi:hypothetical protein
MYLMIGTRPDLAAAVSIISQFASRPTQTHLTAARRVLRYLKGSIGRRLHLGSGSTTTKNDTTKNLRLTGYSDANWGGDQDRRSTSGYLFYCYGGLVSWSSKKQPIVALSSTEAEYIALTHAAKEAIWLRSLIGELQQNLELEPTLIYEDNQSCIALAKNPVFHARSKHIDIRHHFIRDKVESKEIELAYMSTNEMIADALTKALPHPRFSQHVGKMGLCYDDDYRDREGATNNATFNCATL